MVWTPPAGVIMTNTDFNKRPVSFKPTAALRDPIELVAHGLASVADLPDLEKVAARYAVAVTPAIAALIDPDDPDDPIARQFIPRAEELVTGESEDADPIGDYPHSPVSGIVHRYPDRVLFKLVHVCAVYCRFCFRREMVGPGKGTALSQGAYDNALAYIRAHPEIWEVILTGGDPLMLSPRRLAEIMADLAGIDHVKVMQAASYPCAGRRAAAHQRGDGRRIEGRGRRAPGLRCTPIMPENDGQARAACGDIVDAGIPMVSQSVLLRGVNDNEATLEALMRAFVECRMGRLLPSSRRPRARHRASAHHARARSGTDAKPARAGLRTVPAGLRARHSRWPWQVAGRSLLSGAGKFSFGRA